MYVNIMVEGHFTINKSSLRLPARDLSVVPELGTHAKNRILSQVSFRSIDINV